MVRFMISCCTAAWILAVISTPRLLNMRSIIRPQVITGCRRAKRCRLGRCAGPPGVQPEEHCSERSEEMPGAVRRLVRA